MTNEEATEVAIAVQAWLDFQAACRRETLLSEHFLRQPFFEALRPRHAHGIVAEDDHPYFVNVGRGRNRQVDYALYTRGDRNARPRVATAIEVKWTDGAEQHQGVVTDLLRLEHYRRSGAAVDGQALHRFFVLAGKVDDVTTALDRQVNVGGGRASFVQYILPTNPGVHTVEVLNCPDEFRRFFRAFFDSYAVELPQRFRLTTLEVRSGNHARILMWRINSMENRRTFSPADEW